MCNKRQLLFKVLAFLMLGAFAAPAYAYQPGTVTNGGNITGKVSFKGTPPKNPVIDIGKDQKVCGSKITADYYVIGPDGALKNAVVMVEDIKQGKTYNKNLTVQVDNNKCMFEPHVSVGMTGQQVIIVNSDPVLHNTHMYQGPRERTLYNLALPLQNVKIKKKLKRPGLVTVKCDEHEWMLSYIYVAEHPYITVTSSDGSYAITDVPPGTYKVRIWHEKLGETTREVTVKAGSTAQLDYTFSK